MYNWERWCVKWVRRFKVPAKVNQPNGNWWRLIPRHCVKTYAIRQMKLDDSGWYKWNESEMKYISQVKEPAEDIGEWNRLRGKWLLEEMSFELRVNLRCGWSKHSRRSGIQMSGWDEWTTAWRSSLGRAFQRTGAWWVNDLLVILSRDETAGCVSVIEAEERVDVQY